MNLSLRSGLHFPIVSSDDRAGRWVVGWRRPAARRRSSFSIGCSRAARTTLTTSTISRWPGNARARCPRGRLLTTRFALGCVAHTNGAVCVGGAGVGRRRVRRAWLAQERPGQFRFRDIYLRPFVKAILNTHLLADGEREGRTAVQPLAVLRREGPDPEHPQRHGPVIQADPRPPLRLPRQQRLRQDHAAPAHRQRRAARLPEASADAAGGSGTGGGRSQRCRRSRVSPRQNNTAAWM